CSAWDSSLTTHFF
nr:immunoglobulin light chain junction region [Macaca mulatta]MPO03620.1 immunoglobulin light chain junction region [Macaca mulatta]MPO05609.1 immunoglobulin light chain junction region [Macaca mulatta]MPO05991.1 immunoglobulin light chain junction region [Macaca mulatta]MPO06257.1 immunoglobulin light chain junction region [Macaca mulatta]